MFAPRAGRFLLPPLPGLALLVVADLVLRPPGPPGDFLIGAIALLLALELFFAQFFRDPDRQAGSGIVSPADGHVTLVRTEGDRIRIAVFMNVTDVHVNRFPMAARVDSVEEGGAGFAPAYRTEAAGNVQRAYHLATSIGPVTVVQITGIVARRLVSFVRTGESHTKGDRLGMIVLGSRVDVLLPALRVRPVVAPGDRVRAGTSTIATELP